MTGAGFTTKLMLFEMKKKDEHSICSMNIGTFHSKQIHPSEVIKVFHSIISKLTFL